MTPADAREPAPTFSRARTVFTKEMVEELFRLSPELEMAVIEAAEVLSAAFAEYEAERRRIHRARLYAASMGVLIACIVYAQAVAMGALR